MVVNQRAKNSRKGTLFPQVNAAARAFGVHRITLYRVLKGQFPDRQNLKNRYSDWLRQNAGTGT